MCSYRNTPYKLTHWGRVPHICVSKLTIIGSENGLSPGRRQAFIWTNTGVLLIGPLGTNFREILIEIDTFSFTKMHLKMSSGKWMPLCLGLNVVKSQYHACRCLGSISSHVTDDKKWRCSRLPRDECQQPVRYQCHHFWTHCGSVT